MTEVFNEEVLNQSGEILAEFCALNELIINITWSSHRTNSFLDNRGNKSTIDNIRTNRTIHPKETLDVSSESSLW